MHTGQLVQNHAQVLRAPGNFHAHERFDGLGITERVAEAANAANTFCNIDELVDVARLDELLNPRCTKPICGIASITCSSSTTRSRCKGSGNTGCCGPKRNHGRLAHATHRLSQTRRLERRAPSLQMLPSLSQLCLPGRFAHLASTFARSASQSTAGLTSAALAASAWVFHLRLKKQP